MRAKWRKKRVRRLKRKRRKTRARRCVHLRLSLASYTSQKNAKHINTYTASKTSSVSWPICFHACLFLLNNSTALLALLAFNRRTKRESTGYSTRTQHSYLSVSTTLSPHILLLTMRGKRSVWLCSICLVLGWVAILASWRGVYFLVLSLYILLVCRFLKEMLGSIILPPLLHRNIRQFITEVGEHVKLVFPALRPLRNYTRLSIISGIS